MTPIVDSLMGGGRLLVSALGVGLGCASGQGLSSCFKTSRSWRNVGHHSVLSHTRKMDTTKVYWGDGLEGSM